jgi:hypothetical protein
VSDTEDGLGFIERVIELLDGAHYTATYKFAVLVALIDCCVEASAEDGEGPSELPARAVAGRVLELFWQHAVPAEARRLVSPSTSVTPACPTTW